MINERFIIKPEVDAGLKEGRPVVALESTVISHGLPYPANLETAQAMEAAVREAGATPATIAVLQGQIRVGLSPKELEYLATRPPLEVWKCSRKDLSAVVARREDGATTVAATMIIAHLAGIRLFATGGIGGVHRGNFFDTSADLTELGRTPVTVVCSGAKSILDLPKTREVLETQGVAVVGYRTDNFPAFFSADSGLPVDLRLETPDEVAEMIEFQEALGMQSGILVTVPAPGIENVDSQEIESAVFQANKEVETSGVRGAEVTPWLLARVGELTAGRSIRINLALLKNNAWVAAQIAVALSERISQAKI